MSKTGKLYVLALGEIYRSVEVLGSSAKFYKPWLLSYADPTGIFSLLRECSNLWSSSGLEEAFLSISDPIGFEYNVTPKELLESVKYIHDIDVLALHNQVFSGQEPTCRLTLLPAGTVQGITYYQAPHTPPPNTHTHICIIKCVLESAAIAYKFLVSCFCWSACIRYENGGLEWRALFSYTCKLVGEFDKHQPSKFTARACWVMRI